MKKLRLFLLFVTSLLSLQTNAFAIEFKDIDFITGTLLEVKTAKYIPIKDNEDLRIYISSEGKVEFIDKKNNATLPLFDSIQNPLLIYEIETKKPEHIFYAIFDRSAKYDMATNNFALIVSEGKGKPFKLLTDLSTLKENGWTATGLMLRLKNKNLFIDGVNRSKRSPDNEVHPFEVTYDEKNMTVSFENIKAREDTESIPKRLKAQGEFVLAGFTCGDNIEAVTKHLGNEFKAVNITENELAAKAKAKEAEEKSKKDTKKGEDDKDSKDDDEDEEIDENEVDKENIRYFVSHTYSKNLAFVYDKANGSIWQILTTSKDFSTVRGVTVGMTLKEVFDNYGHEYKRRRTGQSIEYVYTIKKQNPASNDMNELVFVVNSKERVILIYVKKLPDDK